MERGFGILKARCPILLKYQETTITNVSDVIIACLVLHHFSQCQNDHYSDRDGILQKLINNERATKGKRSRVIPMFEEGGGKEQVNAVH